MKRHTSITAHLIAFCRFLRQKGFIIGPEEEAETLLAIELLQPYSDQENFKLALRSVLTRSRKNQIMFDELYAKYWEELAKAQDAKIKELPEEKPKKKKTQQAPSIQSIKNWLYQNQLTEETELAQYSDLDILTNKDFNAFNDDGLQEVLKLIHLIARSLANQLNRRYKVASHGIFDVKRTLRQNLRRGGEIVDLVYQKKQIRQLKLVLLCDVSKSMDLYSHFLIQFVYAFQNAYKYIDTFVFSTSLHRISRELEHRDFDTAMRALKQAVPNWSGGTKIGSSFQTFFEDYGSKLLDNQTVVLIMSDGWDTGEIELLGTYMKKIHRKAAKVIWLNPLAGSLNFEPSVQGMKEAMPYIDVFAPAHNVESLKAIIHQLRRS